MRRPSSRPSTRLAGLLRRLLGETHAATLTEFALISPVLFLMIMGLFDMAHTQYTNSMLNGALQKAGRDLTLEGAGTTMANINTRVANSVRKVVPPTATVRFEALSHFDFSDIGEGEEFSDDNGDRICNNNEVFVDDNSNARWDNNRGANGIGGARDAVLYTAIVTYPRLFPMYRLAGMPQNVTLRASTVLRNQPYDEQDRNAPTGNCT